MKKVIINDIKYEIVEDNRNCYDEELLIEKMTDYFDDYDYVLGDFAYGKLRLKGFCDKNNPKYNKINDINDKDIYLEKECAYKCKYFLIKKIK